MVEAAFKATKTEVAVFAGDSHHGVNCDCITHVFLSGGQTGWRFCLLSLVFLGRCQRRQDGDS